MEGGRRLTAVRAGHAGPVAAVFFRQPDLEGTDAQTQGAVAELELGVAVEGRLAGRDEEPGHAEEVVAAGFSEPGSELLGLFLLVGREGGVHTFLRE
jgi:hypothetical protein